MSHAEHPDYQLIKSEKTIEVRDYPPMIFAEVEVAGPRKQAIREGFKILADYIFGNNTSAKKIYRKNLKSRDFGKEAHQNLDSERATIADRQGASENQNYDEKPTSPKTNSSGCFGIEKTTPHTGELSEKIAMTAPVMQEKHIDTWKIKFVMPKKYKLETLPKPHCKKIRLVLSNAKRFAVIRFSGLPSDENIEQRTEELKSYCLAKKWILIGDVLLAFYNPPWTLPFLRRNEIMIQIGIHQ